MSTIKAAAILFFATAATAASATDFVSVPTSTQSQITRVQVKQELQQAIANGEIRHGDLVDFQGLVEQSVQRTTLADNRAKPAETKTADTHAQVAQQVVRASSGQ